MNSIHEKHVSSQEKHRSMSHTFLNIITYPWEQYFQRTKNFVLLIPYEKVMPILVKMPRNFSVTKFRTFLQELRNYWEKWWWTNEIFNILCIYFVQKNYYLGPTCNSKLQIIKFSFVWSAHPKRWGTPTSKIHISSTVRS